MAAVGFVFGVKPGAVELCQGLGLPQTVTATSRSLDGSCSLPSAFVTISKLPPVYTVLQSSSLSLRLRTVTSSAAITSFFDTSSEISKFGFSTGRLWRVEHGPNVRVQSLGATEEAHMPFEKDRRSLETTYFTETSPPTPPSRSRDRADDLSLNNPLLRQHRLGCGWLGVVLEWEGVIVEDDSELERKAWTALAEEEGKRPPPAFILKRAEGMKNEQAISEVLCWSRDFLQMKRLAIRKEELYEEMQGGLYRLRPGSREFVQTLKKHEIPIAVASTRPRKYLERAIEAVGAVQCSLGRHSLPFLPSLAAASIRPTASDTTRCHCQAAPAFFCLLVALLLFRFGGHLRDFRDFRNLGFLGFVRESSWEIGRWKERE